MNCCYSTVEAWVKKVTMAARGSSKGKNVLVGGLLGPSRMVVKECVGCNLAEARAQGQMSVVAEAEAVGYQIPKGKFQEAEEEMRAFKYLSEMRIPGRRRSFRHKPNGSRQRSRHQGFGHGSIETLVSRRAHDPHQQTPSAPHNYRWPCKLHGSKADENVRGANGEALKAGAVRHPKQPSARTARAFSQMPLLLVFHRHRRQSQTLRSADVPSLVGSETPLGAPSPR